jgi:hypothetical protein
MVAALGHRLARPAFVAVSWGLFWQEQNLPLNCASTCLRFPVPLACTVMTDSRNPPAQAPGALGRIGRAQAVIGKLAARGRAASTKVFKSIVRRRVLVPACIMLLLAGAYPATLWLHSLLARSGSTDAWAVAIGTVATVQLVLVTAWYAYLTFSLLEAQRAAPRAVSWESALREVSRYIVDNHWSIWPIALSMPVDTSKPPESEEIAARASTLSEVGIKLLKLAPQLPDAFMRKVLDVSNALTAASNEQATLGIAVAEATVGAEGKHVTWDGARRHHEGGSEPGSWNDMLAGRRVLAAKTKWDDLSQELVRELTN